MKIRFTQKLAICLLLFPLGLISCKRESKRILGSWDIWRIDTCGTSSSITLEDGECINTALHPDSTIKCEITHDYWGAPIDDNYTLSGNSIKRDSGNNWSNLYYMYDKKNDELELHDDLLVDITYYLRRN